MPKPKEPKPEKPNSESLNTDSTGLVEELYAIRQQIDYLIEKYG